MNAQELYIWLQGIPPAERERTRVKLVVYPLVGPSMSLPLLRASGPGVGDHINLVAEEI